MPDLAPDLAVAEFDFALPESAIAQRPAEPRDQARLLRIAPDGLTDHHVLDLPALLEPGDHLVFNDTRVIPARLDGRVGGAPIEITLHRAVSGDSWRAFGRPGKRLKVGARLDLGPGFSAIVVERGGDGDALLRFDRGGAALMAALAEHGRIPLPPYIRGGRADARDRTDYQTRFAARDGAVAAPTAALHFTDRLMAALAERGVGWSCVTLHVGAGTFLPVRVERVADHRMHPEHGVVEAAAAERINRARSAGGRIVAVGTTSLRLLESAVDEHGHIRPFAGDTALFITPGYRFRAIDRLITNFHLPKSTLMMLVAAFAGLDRIRDAYAHAVAAGYRFYSYGDACLILPR